MPGNTVQANRAVGYFTCGGGSSGRGRSSDSTIHDFAFPVPGLKYGTSGATHLSTVASAFAFHFGCSSAATLLRFERPQRGLMTPSDGTDSSATETVERAFARGKNSPLRIPNNLLALGSAAVMTIYSAGYLRTKSSADRFADEDGARRRPAPPSSPTSLEPPKLSVSRIIADSALAKPMTSKSGGVNSATQNSSPTIVRKSAASTAADTIHATDASIAGSTTTTESAPAASDSVKSVANSAPVSDPAPAPTPVVAVAVAVAPKMQLHDGTYTGYGTSRHGDIEATVVIEGGRIATAAISRCLTRYSCSWVAHLQQQVVTRQSPEVDYVSGATESTNAFYYAVVEALTKAK